MSGNNGIWKDPLLGCNSLTAINVDSDNASFSSSDGVLYSKGKDVLIRCPCGFSGPYLIPPGTAKIDLAAFNACILLDSVVIPSGVTSIGDYAFQRCIRLKELKLSDSLASIGKCAFYYCQSLRTMTIPASVSRIGDRAFQSCTDLESTLIYSSKLVLEKDVFNGSRKLQRLVFIGDAPKAFELAKSPLELPLLRIFHFDGGAGFSFSPWLSYSVESMGTPTPVKSWLINSHLPYNSNLQLDPNGDGVNLLMAYALNLDPNLNLPERIPQPILSAHELSLTFYAGTPGIQYAVESSLDLTNWSKQGVTLSAPDGSQKRTATVARDSSSKFLRLVVSE